MVIKRPLKCKSYAEYLEADKISSPRINLKYAAPKQAKPPQPIIKYENMSY